MANCKAALAPDALRRLCVPELVAAIDDYIANHNLNPKPFIWTKTAADILEKVIRANSRSSCKQNAHYTRMINIGS